MRNPSGPTRCKGQPVAAHSRAALPVLGGISGSTKTTWNGRKAAAARRRALADIGEAYHGRGVGTGVLGRVLGASRLVPRPVPRLTRLPRGK